MSRHHEDNRPYWQKPVPPIKYPALEVIHLRTTAASR